jgi:hypothetical protein
MLKLLQKHESIINKYKWFTFCLSGVDNILIDIELLDGTYIWF